MYIYGNTRKSAFTTGQELKESFKDKRFYLECCHSGSGFGQIFKGVDPGRGKNR